MTRSPASGRTYLPHRGSDGGRLVSTRPPEALEESYLSEPIDDGDPNALIAELREWNDGDGVGARSWIEMVGRYDLAVGYSLVFWPRFIRFDGYVLREEVFDEPNLRNWERTQPGKRQGIEATINHLHVADLHCNDETLTEGQARHLGRTLKATWTAKLQLDFPELVFVVAFNDEPGLDLVDYELTFWQADTVT